MLATTYARWHEASKIVGREGLFSTGSMGQKVEHPAAKIERESLRAFERLGGRSGSEP
jgi:hypothetical protein